MPETFFQKLTRKHRQGLLPMVIRDRLIPCGLEIVPYYLLQSGSLDEIRTHFDQSDYEGFELTELRIDDLPRITGETPGREVSEPFVRKMFLDKDTRCFAQVKAGHIACFTWIDLRKCVTRYRHKRLTDNECYFFDIFTFPQYRGQRLAAYNRYRIMEKLHNEGKDTFYSIIETIHTPSLRATKILCPRKRELCLALKLFNKRWFHWTLRRYGPDIKL